MITLMSVDDTNTELRQRSIRKVTKFGALIDGVLGLVKLVAGWLVHSPALVADGFHSLSDLLTDFGVLFFSHWAQHGPDDDHPYGHHRYETLGTVILGTSLVVVASFIAWDSLLSMIYGTHSPQASWVAIAVALVSIVSKEWIFRFTYSKAKEFNSQLLEANAWHSRSDAWSSIVVLLGVGATWFGYPWVELLAAIIVALMIGKMGVGLTWNATQDLVDRGLEPKEIEEIRQTIESTEGVIDAHMLRTRRMGNQVFLDVHIRVAAKLTVSEGHFIAEKVELAVQQHDQISDATVHVDYQKNEPTASTLLALPGRSQITKTLAALSVEPERLQVHYLNDQLVLELFFQSKPEDTLKKALADLHQQEQWLADYFIYIDAT